MIEHVKTTFSWQFLDFFYPSLSWYFIELDFENYFPFAIVCVCYYTVWIFFSHSHPQPLISSWLQVQLHRTLSSDKSKQQRGGGENRGMTIVLLLTELLIKDSICSGCTIWISQTAKKEGHLPLAGACKTRREYPGLWERTVAASPSGSQTLHTALQT